MDTDVEVTTSAAESDPELTERVSAAYDEAMHKIGADVYRESMDDFTNVYLHKYQDQDETLARAYDRAQSKDDQALTANPALPHFAYDPNGSGDFWDQMVRAEADWREKPTEQRKDIAEGAQAARELKDVAKKFFGLDVNSAADVVALQKALNGMDGNGGAPAPVWQDLGIPARNNAEAVQHLSQSVEAIKRDPFNGLRGVLESFGVHPAWLVRPHEYATQVPPQYRHYLPPDYYQPQQQQQQGGQHGDPQMDYARAVIQEWSASHPDVDGAMIGEMADLIASPGFKKDGSALRMMDKAHRHIKSKRGRKSSRQRSDESLDAELRAAADEVYG